MATAEQVFKKIKGRFVDLSVVWEKFINKLAELPVSIRVSSKVQQYNDLLKDALEREQFDLSDLLYLHENLLTHAKDINKNLRDETENMELNDLNSTMINISQASLNDISDYKIKYDPNEFGLPSKSKLTPEESQLNKLIIQLDKFKLKFAEDLTAQNLAIDNITGQLETMDERLKDNLQPLSKLTSDAETYLDEKKAEIDSFLGLVSGNVLAGSYNKYAKSEQIMAEVFRGMTIFFMAGITGLIGYTLYQSTLENFNLETALFRLAFSIVLSIPTAYFAKESSKHRQQQQLYLQTYLDLIAIDPYVSKMNEDDKYRIKALVANRIFSKNNLAGNSSDSYPINVQQLIEKLIDSIDIKEKKEKPE